MKLTKNILVAAFVAALTISCSKVFASSTDVQTIVSSHEKIEKLGFEKALEESSWPLRMMGTEDVGEWNGDKKVAEWDNCDFNPYGPGCPQSGTSSANYELKDDAVQIIATEVLYQTLTYFKVTHVFGKVKGTSNWGFKVINPIDGGYYQDLDTEAVVYAMRQFRKYVIGLLCNSPSPKRLLSMMNKYDIGTRFRWDMAWALMGNDLPDTPNKFMSFGSRWRKFSMALDGIMTDSMIRLQGQNNQVMNMDPTKVVSRKKKADMSYIVNEAVGIFRLVGDSVSAVLELICISDLSVNKGKEVAKETAIYKLLALKKKAYDRYAPLRPVLDDMGKQASAMAKTKITFLP